MKKCGHCGKDPKGNYSFRFGTRDEVSLCDECGKQQDARLGTAQIHQGSPMTRICTDCDHGDTNELYCNKYGNTVNRAVAKSCAGYKAKTTPYRTNAPQSEPQDAPPLKDFHVCPNQLCRGGQQQASARPYHAKVIACYSNTLHCPFRNGAGDMDCCNAANGKLTGVEWGQSPDWCPLRTGPITVERAT